MMDSKRIRDFIDYIERLEAQNQQLEIENQRLQFVGSKEMNQLKERNQELREAVTKLLNLQAGVRYLIKEMSLEENRLRDYVPTARDLLCKERGEPDGHHGI